MLPPETSGENIQEKNPVKVSKNAHYILKFIFNELRNEFKGAMIIMGDTAESSFTTVETAIDKEFSVNISSGWNDFLDSIKRKKKEVTENSSNFLVFIKKIESYFQKSISNTKIDKINKIIITTEDSLLRTVLIKNLIEPEILSLISHGFDVEIQMDSEITYYENESQSDEGLTGETPLQSVSEVNADEFLLDVIPLIEPNKGIKASEVTVGEKIYVRIVDDSTIGKHIARSITGIKNPEEIPVIAPVVDLKRSVISKFRASSEVIEMKLKLDDGVYGKIVVQTEVKLRKKTEEIEEDITMITKTENGNETEQEQDSGYFAYLVIIGLIALVLFGIIKLLG